MKANPNPIPNNIPPLTNFQSIVLLVGISNLSSKSGFSIEFFIKLKNNINPNIATPIITNMEPSQFSLKMRKSFILLMLLKPEEMIPAEKIIPITMVNKIFCKIPFLCAW